MTTTPFRVLTETSGYDVLVRWIIEPSCVAGVGRVLPESYLYFSSNGSENTFRESYQVGDAWDWSLASP